MKNKQKIISITTIVSGIVLIVTGLFSTGFYISAVFDSSDKADKSVIFWFIPIFMIGFIMIVVGFFFCLVGYRSIRGNESAAKESKYMLLSLVVLLFVLILFSVLKSVINWT